MAIRINIQELKTNKITNINYKVNEFFSLKSFEMIKINYIKT